MANGANMIVPAPDPQVEIPKKKYVLYIKMIKQGRFGRKKFNSEILLRNHKTL